MDKRLRHLRYKKIEKGKSDIVLSFFHKINMTLVKNRLNLL